MKADFTRWFPLDGPSSLSWAFAARSCVAWHRRIGCRSILSASLHLWKSILPCPWQHWRRLSAAPAWSILPLRRPRRVLELKKQPWNSLIQALFDLFLFSSPRQSKSKVCLRSWHFAQDTGRGSNGTRWWRDDTRCPGRMKKQPEIIRNLKASS